MQQYVSYTMSHNNFRRWIKKPSDFGVEILVNVTSIATPQTT